MVKVQKPNPKTLNKGVNKDKKSNNIKKEKFSEKKKAIPATNGAAKKEKLKLIEKTINETSKVALKSTKKVGKNKKVPATKPVKKEEPIFKKIDKKTKAKPQLEDAVVETKSDSKRAAKKTPKVVVDQKSSQQNGGKKEKKKVPPAAPVTGKKNEKLKTNNKAPAAKAQKNSSAAPAAKAQKNASSNAHTAKALKNASAASTAKAQKNGSSAAPTAKGKKKKQAAGKGEKKPVVPVALFKAVPFDEDKFNAIVSLENIKRIGEALKTLVEKEVNGKKNSIFEDYRYLLNVCSFKIPNCPKRIVKLNLAHSLVDTNEDDVVIIVPDLQRGAKVDYEPTIQHYEDILREFRLKIVPFNQLRQECTTFEAKRKFASTYDYFLCDGRIVGHVVGFGGSYFQKPRTTFHAVRLNNDKTYKQDVDQALKRTAFKQIEKGNLISIPVGNHRFTVDQLADNIKLVVEQLKIIYPGGLDNIRNMHIKIDITGTSSLPIYASWATPPADTPNVIGIREQRMLKLKKEANEVLTQFNMSKTGEFVKLDKAQAERKRKIQEARKAILTNSDDGGESVETKKLKKSKKEITKGGKKQNASDEEDDVDDDEAADEDDDEDNDTEDNDTEDEDAGSDDEE